MDEPRTAIGIKGSIVRTEDVEGRKDLVALAIKYSENEVPMAYKMHINAYLNTIRKVSPQEQGDEEKGNPKPDKTQGAKGTQAPVDAAAAPEATQDSSGETK
jgi:hypothetical protein